VSIAAHETAKARLVACSCGFVGGGQAITTNLQILPDQDFGSYSLCLYRARTGYGGSSGAAFAVPPSAQLGFANAWSLAPFGLIELAYLSTLAQGQQPGLHRRLLSAVETLARVRKMAFPSLLVNIAKNQQVNVGETRP
jgi:hypothetical protein